MTLAAPALFALLLLAAAPLAGCAQPGGGTAKPAATQASSASGGSAPAEPTRLSAVYDCGKDRIAARFGGGGVTIGLPDGRSLALPQAAGGYSDGSITFRESGGLASVTTPTGSWTDCKLLS